MYFAIATSARARVVWMRFLMRACFKLLTKEAASALAQRWPLRFMFSASRLEWQTRRQTSLPNRGRWLEWIIVPRSRRCFSAAAAASTTNA